MKKLSYRTVLMFFIFCNLHFVALSVKGQQVSADTHITSVAETNASYWVGTSDGLWRISKKNNSKEHYTTANSHLPSNRVSSICIDADDNVWVGTSAGILRYDNYAFYVVNSRNANIPDNDITAIACDANHGVWIGTAHGGLVKKVQYGRFVTYNSGNSKLPSNNVLSINCDGNGNVWVATQNNGLVLVQNEKWSLLDGKAGFDGKDVMFVAGSTCSYSMYCANGDEYTITKDNVTKRAGMVAVGTGISVRYSLGKSTYWLHNNGATLQVVGSDEKGMNRVKNNFYLLDSLLSAHVTASINP